MPYKDPDKARISARERKKRYRRRKKEERYGPDVVQIDMRGKHGNHAKGCAHGRWNDHRIVSSHGYVKVRVGREHPLADPNGYAYEHLVVWCAAGNPPLGEHEILHHRNHDKTDNRLSNLEVMTQSQHVAHHNRERGKPDPHAPAN